MHTKGPLKQNETKRKNNNRPHLRQRSLRAHTYATCNGDDLDLLRREVTNLQCTHKRTHHQNVTKRECHNRHHRQCSRLDTHGHHQSLRHNKIANIISAITIFIVEILIKSSPQSLPS